MMDHPPGLSPTEELSTQNAEEVSACCVPGDAFATIVHPSSNGQRARAGVA